MEFGEQISALRRKEGLTQERFAERLLVTRQAVSNWENDRNLPDIEMLIRISKEFHVSLDQLILGGEVMNNMTEKLIKDGNETRRARMNMVTTITGGVLLIIGLTCFIIKGASVEYVDSAGMLHENFFLIPIGFLFILCGFVTIALTGLGYLIKKRREKRSSKI
jgi:transcriptional regulator with XRE-family HTH domain